MGNFELLFSWTIETFARNLEPKDFLLWKTKFRFGIDVLLYGGGVYCNQLSLLLVVSIHARRLILPPSEIWSTPTNWRPFFSHQIRNFDDLFLLNNFWKVLSLDGNKFTIPVFPFFMTANEWLAPHIRLYNFNYFHNSLSYLTRGNEFMKLN